MVKPRSQQPPKIGAIANWFGTNRQLAPVFAEALGDVNWIGIPFCGGLSEVPFMPKKAKILCNDKHELLILLAREIADPEKQKELKRRLKTALFHPAELYQAQNICIDYLLMDEDKRRRLSDKARLAVVMAYFVTSWMSRAGTAGTGSEFKGSLPLRFSTSGGCSLARWKSAIDSLDEWTPILQNCSFSCLDFRDFLAKCKKQDSVKSAIYVDSPFPQTAKKYKHGFSPLDFVELADALAEFKKSRIVVRYYDCKIIRELYPKKRWHHQPLKGRKQTNAEAPELLITNRL